MDVSPWACGLILEVASRVQARLLANWLKIRGSIWKWSVLGDISTKYPIQGNLLGLGMLLLFLSPWLARLMRTN